MRNSKWKLFARGRYKRSATGELYAFGIRRQRHRQAQLAHFIKHRSL